MKNWRLVRQLKEIFTSPIRVQNLLILKDKMLLSGLAYMYKFAGSNSTYYGKTKRHFKVRIFDYLGISLLTGKEVKIDNSNNNNKVTAI